MGTGDRRLAAIMFTDMVGYMLLGRRDEPLSLALVDEHRKLLRPVFARHSGREVKTIGDAFLVEFPNSLEAVRCAYDVQRASREFNISLQSEKRIRLRVGIHLGDVVESEGDILGDAVNMASRVEPLAEDGGVTITQQVYDQVRGKFELRFETLGSKSVKNVDLPVEVYRMIMPWDRDAGLQASQLDRRRVAILPFANMSSDPKDEYFADGMTEEVIATTSLIKGLTLIARTSMMGYKGATKKISEIGKELSAGTILEGSVRKAGNKIRVTIQMIDAQNEGHLWAKSYDRNLDDVFAVQSDIAKQVADALSVQILPNELLQVEKRTTGSTDAYTLYLKGRYYSNQRNKESLLRAIEYFEQATKKDERYALAYSGIADCYEILGDHEYVDYSAAFSKALENALTAVRLDSSSAEAHTSLALALSNDYDWEGAEREFKKALELNPNYSTAHLWYGTVLWNKGRFEEALEEASFAQQLDPLSIQAIAFTGQVYVRMGRHEQAEEEFSKALGHAPNFIPARIGLAWLYFRQGKYSQAAGETEEVIRLRNNPGHKVYLAMIYAWSERIDQARKVLDELKSHNEWNIPGRGLALVYLGLGEDEKAIEVIQRELARHADWLPEIIFEPMFSRVRSDPRVIETLEKIGLANEISRSLSR